MSKFKKFISMVLGVVLCFTIAISIAGCGNTNNDDEMVTVIDMLGEQVTVKKNPKKVACASRTTYDLLIALVLRIALTVYIIRCLIMSGRRYLTQRQMKDIVWRIKKVMKRTLHVESISCFLPKNT